MGKINGIFRYQKYMSFFRMRFLAGLQYRAAAFAGVITQFAWGFMEILVFRAFYEVNPGAFPMTREALSSYIWLQQALLALFMTWFLENDIFHTITDGGIAYELCRPTDLYVMWFFRSMANRLSKAVLRCLPILIVAAFLPAPYGMRLPASPKAGLWFLITGLLGFLVVVAFCMLVYIATFYTYSPVGIRMVAISMVEFLSGSVVPLPFLPEGFRQLIELLPFASMQNVPFRIYSGDISGMEIYTRAGLQLFWYIALVWLGKRLTAAALKRVVIQGG
ncbi:MAG TPA: ABC transporter permease [Clostridiales bacterium]|nr:ABC transporter permease [Clostridiales bacterium]